MDGALLLLLLGGQLGRSRLGGDATSVGRDARGELDDVDKARANNGTIVDRHADSPAVLVVANVVVLLVVGAGDGDGLALDLLLNLKLQELLGVQADDARVGSDLGSVLVMNDAQFERVSFVDAGGVSGKNGGSAWVHDMRGVGFEGNDGCGKWSPY